MSSFELKLFINEFVDIKEKFFILMHLLIQNQSISLFESLLFCFIYIMQQISVFFAEEVNVFDKENNVSDKILNYIYQLIRFKNLFFDNSSYYNIAIICITLYLIVFFGYFVVILRKTTIKSTFNNDYLFLNYMIKFNYYILTTISFDFFSFLICFKREYNRYIKDLKCNPFSNNLVYLILSFFNSIYLTVFVFIMNMFYIESFYLSTSPNAGMSCNIYNIQFFILVINSIMHSLINEFHHGLFFLTNLAMSSFLFYSYMTKMIYYHKILNEVYGFFYFTYLWESIFFFIFYYVQVSEKGLVFILTLFFLYVIFYNLKKQFKDHLIKSTPYHKISNKYYLLYYLKILIDLIATCEHEPESKSLLIGIMQLHVIECPNPDCVTKTRKKLYLPLTNEWSDRTKPFILDFVFLRNFIVVIMGYFVSINFFNPELIINLSYYYLNSIGNICMCIYYYKKVKEMSLTTSEYFLLERLRIMISKVLIEKLKKKNEPCLLLEDLNTSLYYEYEFNAQNFINEIFKDLDLCLEFWSYYSKNNEKESEINFNDVFKTIEKIQDSKKKISKLWEELFSIYSGVNDLFLFYLDYVGTINDDNLRKRELESIQRKIENSADNIQLNYYNILFRSDTGIVLVNGDKGKEGIIVKANYEFGNIFKYNSTKMKGMNITEFMPKIFKNEHYKFMRHYYEIGEKKFLDKHGRKIFAIDNKNSMLLLEKNVKLFPILNHNILYIALMTHEKIDDIIFLDSKFNIQGMSQKLFNKFKILNQNIFNENNIPFYAICKQFINFHKTFLKGNKKKLSPLTTINTSSQILSDKESFEEYLLNEKEKEKEREILEQENNDNIEINENIELEYEIKIPKFILDYSYYTLHKEKTIQVDFSESNSIDEKDIKEEPYQLLLNNQGGKKTVNFNLVKAPVQSLKKTITKKYFETPGILITSGNNINNTPISDDISPSYLNENNCFENKLNQYKNLFNLEKYKDLENLMIEDTMDHECIEIKFNFTFKKYHYGNNQHAYIIRCIDNKNEIVSSGSDVENNIQNYETGNKILKRKINSLKPLIEINTEEKKIFYINILNFMYLLYQNDPLNKSYIEYLKEIKIISRVHGSQQNIIADDENSSQTSASSYNSDLSKLSKIQEIKTNLIKNSDNFYAIKYIRIIPLIFFGLTIIFIVIYILMVFYIFSKLHHIGLSNTSLFITELRLIQIINNIIDMRTLFYIKRKNLNYTMTTFSSTNSEYFSYCKQKVIEWYEEANLEINNLERSIHKYLGKFKEKAWSKVPINYPLEIPFQDSEHFILLISESLVNAYSIVQSPLLTLKYAESIANGTNSEEEYINDNYLEILYSCYMSIEESYNNILPLLFYNIPYLVNNFIDNCIKMKLRIKIIILLYLLSCMIIYIFYYFLITFTNNKLGEGIEKVAKISQNKIEDIIKQINIFKSLYRKKLSKLYHIEDEEKKKKDDENLKINHLDNNQEIGDEKNKESSGLLSNDYSFDVKKHKKLKILKELISYYLLSLIIIIGFIIPLYLLIPYIINISCELIYSHTYLLENFLYSSSSILDMKCKVCKCDIRNDLNFSQILNQTLRVQLYKVLPKFPLFNDFYYNGYMKDTCYSLYDKNTKEYINCKNEHYYINLLNSTDSTKTILLNFVEKEIYQLETSLIEDENFDSLNLITISDYGSILTIYNIYYIPVVEKMNNIVNNSFIQKIKKYKKYLIVINLIFALFIFLNAFYVNFVFLPLLIKRIYISRCFIYIIPSTYISSTQVLENWLEKIDNKNN